MQKLITELLISIQEALNQITGLYPQPTIKYIKFAENKMIEWGVSQSDVEDVFYRGIEYKKDKSKRYKQYRGYQLWISFYVKNGIPTIKNVWKWDGKYR